MDPSFRSSIKDPDGRSFRMTWYMEMDNFINQGLYSDGTPMNYLTLYNELMNNWGAEVHGYGDEMAYHHHFMTWDGTSWIQDGQQHAIDGYYDEHNKALDRMVLDAGFFPTDFRAGWLNNDNQLQAWVEKWLLSDDGGGGWATGWRPYHPSATNYQTQGAMSHWIMNAPGGPSQGGVDGAFGQAIAEGRPVVYAMYMHDRDDMRNIVSSTHTYLQNAAAANPGVRFKYVTAHEAMRAIIGTTDITPPTLPIAAAGGDAYTINSTESLLGAGPYVAGRYGSGSGAVYAHVSASPGGLPGSWTANLPSMNGGLRLEQVGAGALDLAGNSAVGDFRVGSLDVVAAVVPTGVSVSNATPCVTVLVMFTRTETNPARAISVKIQLGAELRLCDSVTPSNSIHPGSWLGAFNSNFQVVDRGSGLYQVDQTILGDPCGVTTGGQLFTLDVTNAGADGTGTLAVTQVSTRDCANATIDSGPGAAANLVVDRTPPSAVADAAASASGSAGSAPGTRQIQLGFTVPGDAAKVEVYRARFGSYPLFDRAPGSGQVPAAPTTYPLPAAWALVPGLTGPGSDDPGSRDYWYYVVVTKDAHGNAALSSPTAGTLDYLLGDTHNGNEGGDCVGNNQVALSDISFLGAHYGLPVPSDPTLECLDVGPTTDYFVSSRPKPDGILNFEDLVLFALNYGTTVAALPARLHASAGPGRLVGPAVASGMNGLRLTVPGLPAVGETFEVGIVCQGAGNMIALSVDLAYDAAVVSPVGIADGELLGLQTSPHVTLSSRPGNVDVALLGSKDGLVGQGTLAKMRFRVLSPGDARLSLHDVSARDAGNRPVTLGQTSVAVVLPATTSLSRAMPTPFHEATTFELALARAGGVKLAIYGVDGRRIRTLVAGEREAGVFRVSWDGRDDNGRAVAAGMFFARLTTPDASITRTVVRVR